MKVGLHTHMVKGIRKFYRIKSVVLIGGIEDAMAMCRVHDDGVVKDKFDKPVFVPKRIEYESLGA